jgi:hypothetical protein
MAPPRVGRATVHGLRVGEVRAPSDVLRTAMIRSGVPLCVDRRSAILWIRFDLGYNGSKP